MALPDKNRLKELLQYGVGGPSVYAYLRRQQHLDVGRVQVFAGRKINADA